MGGAALGIGYRALVACIGAFPGFQPISNAQDPMPFRQAAALGQGPGPATGEIRLFAEGSA
jgi:hypothetical protein